MFGRNLGYGKLIDFQPLRDSQLPAQNAIELQPQSDVFAYKKGGRVKKIKQKQKQKQKQSTNIKINIDNSNKSVKRRRYDRKKVVEKPLEKMNNKPQYVTQVLGGQAPTQPLNFAEFNKRLSGIEDKINAPKVLGADSFNMPLDFQKFIETFRKDKQPASLDIQADPAPASEEEEVVVDDEKIEEKEDAPEPGMAEVTARPIFNDDIMVGGAPLYDTGVDYTYQRKNARRQMQDYTSRVYITKNGTYKIKNTKNKLVPLSQIFPPSEAQDLRQFLSDRGITGYPARELVV
jgi:hypothetical protein